MEPTTVEREGALHYSWYARCTLSAVVAVFLVSERKETNDITVLQNGPATHDNLVDR